MTKLKRISEVLKRESEYDKYVRVAHKARKPRSRITKEPPPIGHILALMIFLGAEHLETLFVDNIDVGQRYTVIHYDRSHVEHYLVELESENIDLSGAWFFYKNNTSIHVTRI